MSTICKFKILDAKTRILSPQEIVKNCYDNREDIFNKWCKKMDIVLTKDDRRVKVDRFVEIVTAAYKDRGSSLFDKIFNDDFYFIELIDTLHKSYKNDDVLQIVSYHTLFWNNFLAALSFGNYKPLEAIQIKLEIAQVYPGIVVFPKYTFNDTVTKNMERQFLTRILSDIENDDTIDQWFETTGGNLYPSDNYMHFGSTDRIRAEGIIWGFEKGIDVNAKPESPAFRKKYKDTWWLDELPTDLDDCDKDYPLKVVQYSVFIHPRWFPNISEIIARNEINESTAYY